MTRIGQMIFDDGVVRGLEEGRKEGQAEEKNVCPCLQQSF